MTIPQAWQPGHQYLVDDLVEPTVPNGFYYRCRGAGTSDIGLIATGAAATSTGSFDTFLFGTYLNLSNPVPVDMMIGPIQIYKSSALLDDLRVGTFFDAGGGNYTCRDAVDIGTIGGTAHQATATVGLQAKKGDILGCSLGVSGGVGNYASIGNSVLGAGDAGFHVVAGDTSAYNTLHNNRVLSLAGYGLTPTFPLTLNATVTDGTVSWFNAGVWPVVPQRGIIGLEIRSMRRSTENMQPYQRQDCVRCGWPLQVAADGIIHCKFCGWTDQNPLVRQVERP